MRRLVLVVAVVAGLLAGPSARAETTCTILGVDTCHHRVCLTYGIEPNTHTVCAG